MVVEVEVEHKTQVVLVRNEVVKVVGDLVLKHLVTQVRVVV
jgi:hypothetical protein